jgi:hypothetical protein
MINDANTDDLCDEIGSHPSSEKQTKRINLIRGTLHTTKSLRELKNHSITITKDLEISQQIRSNKKHFIYNDNHAPYEIHHLPLVHHYKNRK